MAKVDPAYGVNDFNRAKVLTEAQTIVNNLLMILFGKPGFYPSIPKLGLNIGQYLYLFEDEIDTTNLKARVAAQCQDFLPNLKDGSMDIYTTLYKERTMLIFQLPVIVDENTVSLALGVTINEKGEMVYNFVTGSETQEI